MKSVLLLPVLAVFNVNISTAQWSKLLSFDSSHILNVEYLDYVDAPFLGFILTQDQRSGMRHLLRSSNSGATWQEVLANENIGNLHFRDQLVGWIGGAISVNSSGGCDGIFKITYDGGLTWTDLPNRLCVSALYFDHATNRLWIGNGKVDAAFSAIGLHLSTDLGYTTQRINDQAYLSLSKSAGGSLVGIGQNNFGTPILAAYSPDGANWIASNYALFSGAPVTFHGKQFVVNYEGGRYKLFQSLDDGKTWVFALDLPRLISTPSFTLRSNECAMYLGSFSGFFKSTDEGTTWTKLMDLKHFQGMQYFVRENIVFVQNYLGDNAPSELWRYVEPVELTVPNLIQLSGCKVDSSLLLSYNADCFDGELISAEIIQSSDRFTLGSLTLPQSVSGEFSIPLHYSSLTPGSTDNASLKIRFRAGAYTFDTVIAITANSGAAASKVGFELRPTNASPKPGELTTIGVYPTAATTSAALTDLSLDLSYYDDLFALKNVQSASAVSYMPSIVSGKQTATITLSSPDIKLDPNTPVVEIDLEARLTDTVSSDVTISNIKLNNGDADYARCKLSLDESSGTALSVTLACGDPLIQRVIRGERALAIKSITPNPTNGKLTIDYESKLSGEVTLSVYSVNGVVMHEKVIHSAGKPIQLDTSGWPSGAYTIVLRSGDDEARGTAIKE